MDKTWETGNAKDVGKDRRGWLVGHFIDDPPGIRTTEDVEIKWAHHPAGEERASWVTDEYRTTIIFLVHGQFRIKLPEEDVLLENEGDYLMWGPGTDHLWRAEEESVVVTVRWPSIMT
jgi:hypothetical protein